MILMDVTNVTDALYELDFFYNKKHPLCRLHAEFVTPVAYLCDNAVGFMAFSTTPLFHIGGEPVFSVTALH